MYEKTDGKNKYYCFAKGEYMFEGSSVEYGMITVENSAGSMDLVDTFSGETLLKGYDSYKATIMPDGSLGILARFGNAYVDIFTF